MNVRVVNILSELVPNPSVDHQQVTVSSTSMNLAGALTAGALHENTTHVWFQVKDADVAMTFDNGDTAATATLGMEYVDGSSGVLRAQTFSRIRAIRTASTDAKVDVVEMQY